jgi:hypothetical protein
MTAGLTSSDLLAALRTRYPPPEWYLVSEVANGTGYTGKDRSTYADAVAISAYQSGKTGAEIHGFEIKVSRRDWQAELADIGKAEAVRKWCDRWHLVVPYPASAIVREGELPEGWGLLEVAVGKVKTLKAAPLLHQPKDRPALPRSFIAALVRRASEERGEKEALKAALLKAPMRQVAHGGHGTEGLVLTCGHMHRVLGGSPMPKAVRCLACADGLPPAIEVVRLALRQMDATELRALAVEAEERAKGVDKGATWWAPKLGLSPIEPKPRTARVPGVAVDALARPVAGPACATVPACETLPSR